MKASFRTSIVALSVLAAPALSFGQGFRVPAKQPAQQAPPVTQPGTQPISGPSGQGPSSQSPFARPAQRPGQAPGILPGETSGVPVQDGYAGSWSGQGSWQLPQGPMVSFPVRVDVKRMGQGYTVSYSAEIPPVGGGIQPSPTRWEASFQASVQSNQGYAQPGAGGAPQAYRFLLGQSQNYRATILQSGAQQGPWPASIGLSEMNGSLVGQVGNPDFGFAQFQLSRRGAMPGPGGAPFQPGATGIDGAWMGTAFDELENGQPLQYQVSLNVSRTPNGQIAARVQSTIPYPDPSSGQTYRLMIDETFTGSEMNGSATLQCGSVKLIEAQSRQVLETFPATLRLTSGPQGLSGSLGNDEMGWTEIRFQRAGAQPGMRPGFGPGVNP
ncbi:MAG: hypothetical protein AAGG01_24140, partial [Planctomycetota bacterium]